MGKNGARKGMGPMRWGSGKGKSDGVKKSVLGKYGEMRNWFGEENGVCALRINGEKK